MGENNQREIITYDNYLKIPQLLDCQTELKSNEPTELLFIITHQAFELWFKIVIDDIDWVRENLLKVGESGLHDVLVRLDRIVRIFKLVTQHFAILETMTPMEFMNFRGYLSPASGFQSVQFRLIEIKLGLKNDDRLGYAGNPYYQAFSVERRQQMEQAAREPSLFEIVGRWLEQTPFLNDPVMNFESRFRDGVQSWLKSQDKEFENSGFESLFDDQRFKEGNRQMSRQSILGALMTQLYHKQPRFNQRSEIFNRLLDIEESVFLWRSNHVMMVHRMIGCKPGTGGSSGVGYLHQTLQTEKYRIFQELLSLSTYYVPQAFVPPVPEQLKPAFQRWAQ